MPLTDLLIVVIICGMAAYRLARIMVSDSGPWEVFDRIRRQLDLDQHEVFNCMHCAGLWTALAAFLLFIFVSREVVAVLATAGFLSIAKDLQHRA